MGYSITEERYQKLEANRREGRLCAGPARHDCATRATRKVTQESWAYKIGEGTRQVADLPMCARHGRQFPAGYEGVNFRVLANEAL